MHTPAEKINNKVTSSAPVQSHSDQRSAISDDRQETSQLRANQALMQASPQQRQLTAVQARMAQSSQSKLHPDIKAHQSVGNTESHQVAQLSKLTWTNGTWVSDSEASSSTAKVPKPEGDFEGQVFDDVTGLYTLATVLDESEDGSVDRDTLVSSEGKKEDGGKEEEPKVYPVPELTGVGVAAGKHLWGVAMIGGNNPNPSSFSFAKPETITADTELINKYLSGSPAVGVSVVASPGNKYTITVVRGGQTRVYEVHKDHSLQAFPVSGDGVVNNSNAGCNLDAIKEVVKKTRGRLDRLAPKKMLPWHTNANRINAIISSGN